MIKTGNVDSAGGLLCTFRPVAASRVDDVIDMVREVDLVLLSIGGGLEN
jgi:hypothetical protein